MNEDLDLVDILKSIPTGTKLWSPLYGDCEFVGIIDKGLNPYPINCKVKDKYNETHYALFAANGHDLISDNYINAECILFPSKENQDWNSFKVAKHKKFKPFQKVLVKVTNDDDNHVWVAAIYSHYNKSKGRHYFSNLQWTDDDSFIIPFEGNEDKVGQIAE